MALHPSPAARAPAAASQKSGRPCIWHGRLAFLARTFKKENTPGDAIDPPGSFDRETNTQVFLVTTLKRKATKLLTELESDRTPILITQHGLPAAYLVDVDSYDRLLRRLGLLEGIARGEKAIEEGRVLSHAKAKKRMARWLK